MPLGRYAVSAVQIRDAVKATEAREGRASAYSARGYYYLTAKLSLYLEVQITGGGIIVRKYT
jgi:hypothetical protein